jgi:hypothetical protein
MPSFSPRTPLHPNMPHNCTRTPLSSYSTSPKAVLKHRSLPAFLCRVYQRSQPRFRPDLNGTDWLSSLRMRDNVEGQVMFAGLIVRITHPHFYPFLLLSSSTQPIYFVTL